MPTTSFVTKEVELGIHLTLWVSASCLFNDILIDWRIIFKSYDILLFGE